MIKILHIGDITGRIGRETVAKLLPQLKQEYAPDLVIGNAENSAHGSGATVKTLTELTDAGIDWFTMGDHAFDGNKTENVYENFPIIKPANFPPATPGKGYAVIDVDGKKILLTTLLGRVFMHKDYDCPFRKIDEILANPDLPIQKLSAIIVEMHAEATSEKAAFMHYLNGRVTAVLGTHTHVMTADSTVTDKGTAFITDIGMTGAIESCLGVDKEIIIQGFLTQTKQRHDIPEAGPSRLNAVLLKIDPTKKQAVSITPIERLTDIIKNPVR
jgi:hypothetical protein